MRTKRTIAVEGSSAGEYLAQLEGYPEEIAAGKSRDEAIGKLVSRSPELFEVRISDKDATAGEAAS